MSIVYNTRRRALGKDNQMRMGRQILVTTCIGLTIVCTPAIVLAQHKPATKSAHAAASPAKGPPRGPIERYDCKIGTEDQHARIALQAQGGQVQSVAYYSKWKPRTCSVHLQRGDAYSRWKDTGDATTITTEYGDFLIQVSRGEYQLFFREVDRMHYCGMMGKLNGSMTVTRGPKRECSVVGIMDRDEIEALQGTQELAGASPATDPLSGPTEKTNATD